MPSSCLCFCKASALKGNPGWLFWLASGWLGLAPGWLSGWLGLAPGWLSGWFGLAPGWLSGWLGLAPGWLSGWLGLAPGWLSGWFGLALFFFPVFFSSPCRNAAAGHFASISRGHYFCSLTPARSVLDFESFAGRGQMLDGRVLGASQVEYKPFGKPPLKREPGVSELCSAAMLLPCTATWPSVWPGPPPCQGRNCRRQRAAVQL